MPLITSINIAIVNIIINTKFHTRQRPVCHPRLGQAPHTCLSGHPDDKEHWSTFLSQSLTKDDTLVVPIFYPPLQILPSNITIKFELFSVRHQTKSKGHFQLVIFLVDTKVVAK